MFRRKLIALGHSSPDSLNAENSKDLKVFVLWLEDQKIRHYKIEDRRPLHDLKGAEWSGAFLQYLKDLECPYNFESQPLNVVDWLLGVAVRYEYADSPKRHAELRFGLATGRVLPPLAKARKSAIVIDPSDKLFASGVKALARVLQVTPHPDPSILLEAVVIVIQKHLSVKCDTHEDGSTSMVVPMIPMMFNISAKECGFNLSDPALSEAAKVLRLLHINTVRDLQTSINGVIVSVQAITADPKTAQSPRR